MSFSTVPDGAFTPDEGRGVEPHGSAGVEVLSLGYMAGSMGQLRDERKRDKLYPAARESFPCTLTPQGRPALLAAVKPSKGVSHPLPSPDCARSSGRVMTANAIASQPVSTKKVQLRIYRLATSRKISDCSHVSQSGDPVRKSQWGQQGKEFSWSLDDKDSISSS